MGTALGAAGNMDDGAAGRGTLLRGQKRRQLRRKCAGRDQSGSAERGAGAGGDQPPRIVGSDHKAKLLGPSNQCIGARRRNAEQQQGAVGSRPHALRPIGSRNAGKFRERFGLRVAEGEADADR